MRAGVLSSYKLEFYVLPCLKAAKGFGKEKKSHLHYKKETIDICCDYLEN